jgi:hypothetical protein
MNRTHERDELLADLLTESVPADFHVALLADTLRHARRRRLRRRASRAALVMAMAGALGLFVWRNAPSNPGYAVVRTLPFPSTALVNTRPFGAEWIVATFNNVREVRTRPGAGSLRFVNDDELLAFAAPRIPALVRTGPDTQELIFLTPAEPESHRAN